MVKIKSIFDSNIKLILSCAVNNIDFINDEKEFLSILMECKIISSILSFRKLLSIFVSIYF
jgi:hypothetical protein